MSKFIPDMLFEKFTKPLMAWFDENGRKNLPWQHPRTPYRVWIAEIMLQQTQVITVIPYYLKFMTRFPNLEALYNGSEEEVLALWSGLGYYSRARNIKKTAHILMDQYQGVFPRTINQLADLPGIGHSTAAAILSQAYGLFTAILDGNVRRVISRYFMVDGNPLKASVKSQLQTLADRCMCPRRCADYTQAIMDLGAICCTSSNPKCSICPLNHHCAAYHADVVSSYPLRVKKKSLPVKMQQFLILHSKNEIYLEKRPSSGIWGGLWCLPILSMTQEPLDFFKKYNMHDIGDYNVFMTFRHTFTHFHLDIVAQYARLISLSKKDMPGIWVALDAIQGVGIPAPVQKIVNALSQKAAVCFDNRSPEDYKEDFL